MQSAVIVLLKLLLATVTPNPPMTGLANNEEEGAPPPQLSLEDTDVMRHREITSKSVSAILILMLQWLKTSRACSGQILGWLNRKRARRHHEVPVLRPVARRL
jgi:hypothetical protein